MMAEDEKKASILSESQLSRSDDEDQEITWTEDEEKALVRRYDTVHQIRSS
jgi:rubrerythrin